MALRLSLLGEQLSVSVRDPTPTSSFSVPLAVCLAATDNVSSAKHASTCVPVTSSTPRPSKVIFSAISLLELPLVNTSVLSSGESAPDVVATSSTPSAVAISSSASWRFTAIDLAMPLRLLSNASEITVVILETSTVISTSGLSELLATALCTVTELSPARLNMGREFVTSPVLG